MAPSTESMLQQYEEQRQLPETVRPRGVGVHTQTSARVWAGAWGRSWSGQHGRVRVREQIPMADLRSNVSGKGAPSSRTFGTGVPECVPDLGTPGVPDSGTLFVPKFRKRPRSPLVRA